MPKHTKKIVLVGGPNSGKTSLFNSLTGLHQKVANYPGVTVDAHIGFTSHKNTKLAVIDLPGAYSLYPRSLDEHIVIHTLTNIQQENISLVVVVLNASKLRSGLLLLTQIRDMGTPVMAALNMVEEAHHAGQHTDAESLQAALEVPICVINARKRTGIGALKEAICTYQQPPHDSSFIDISALMPEISADIKKIFPGLSQYMHFQYLQQGAHMNHLTGKEKETLKTFVQQHDLRPTTMQLRETMQRYSAIDALLDKASHRTQRKKRSFTDLLDRILTHKVYGSIILMVMLSLVFQLIYRWAAPLMDSIDEGFAALSTYTQAGLPDGWFTHLLCEGVLPGLGGILMFLPQIVFLFLVISVFEESGYMARVVFLSDKLMRAFGLNGRSVIPLISGMACAIPAIMATRGIHNKKERLLTILVTPLMSCSARLPVYVILIAIAIPATQVWGGLNLQGLLLLGMYFLGTAAALLMALAFKLFLPSKEKSFFFMELPPYRYPQWRNVGVVVWEKSRMFVWRAGRVILLISVMLWFMASYGPASFERNAEGSAKDAVQTTSIERTPPAQQTTAPQRISLEDSYIGHMGTFIAPVLAPLGYDWKINIGLLASFAAREVFVGTMAVIYNVEAAAASPRTLQEKMTAQRHPHTGEPVYSFATTCSLLIFYAFAMQCMSTVAVTYRETKGWPWALVQLIYMSIMAYVGAFAVYQWLQ